MSTHSADVRDVELLVESGHVKRQLNQYESYLSKVYYYYLGSGKVKAIYII